MNVITTEENKLKAALEKKASELDAIERQLEEVRERNAKACTIMETTTDTKEMQEASEEYTLTDNMLKALLRKHDSVEASAPISEEQYNNICSTVNGYTAELQHNYFSGLKDAIQSALNDAEENAAICCKAKYILRRAQSDGRKETAGENYIDANGERKSIPDADHVPGAAELSFNDIKYPLKQLLTLLNTRYKA